MRTITRPAALVAAAAVALTMGAGSPAHAERASIPDRVGDAPTEVDISQVVTKHGNKRLTTVTKIPGLVPGNLSGTEVLIKTPGTKKVYAVTVLRNRKGRVVDRVLTWRPKNDPIEPRVLDCSGIRTSVRLRTAPNVSRVKVSVPKRCLTKTPAERPVKTKVRLTDGTRDLRRAYWNEQTRFSPRVAPGRATPPSAEPFGRVSADGGLVARSLPTTTSARDGKLAEGLTFPIACEVAGEVIGRGDPSDDVSNTWYRLPASRQWVSARYVDVVRGEVAYCGDGRAHAGTVTETVRPREAPVLGSNAHGRFTVGTDVTILCRLGAERVDGNKLWYSLPQGLWVPAATVGEVRETPAYCTS